MLTTNYPKILIWSKNGLQLNHVCKEQEKKSQAPCSPIKGISGLIKKVVDVKMTR
jgi:hypothetical protein